MNDNGDFDLFSYDLYRHFQESTPEFEQLAAFQSGHNTVNVRTGAATAKAETAEYVSGNYFSTFGLGAYAGRMLLGLRRRAWRAAGSRAQLPGLARRARRRPQRDRRDVLHTESADLRSSGFRLRASSGTASTAIRRRSGFRSTIEPNLERETSILKQPDTNWLYVLGRIKPGVNPGSLQAKLSNDLAPVDGYAERLTPSTEPKRKSPNSTSC